MSVIEVKQLTKDYGFKRGVFDVSFHVEKGEVYGFLGPNGAGKTTTIRHIMGFSRPQKGSTSVNGLDSWHHADKIQKTLGYLPGEIALPEQLTGTEFIKMMSSLRGIKDATYTTYLIDKFELDHAVNLKRMSLGMKRKLAIVTAFMHNPDVLVLDEPTSGLDPVMQSLFIEFIKEEKIKGKTILLSSHIFSEIDATCDRISIIKDGYLVSTFIADELKHGQDKLFKIEFTGADDRIRFVENQLLDKTELLTVVRIKPDQNQVIIQINDVNINAFTRQISGYSLKFFSEIKFTLEDYFMKFYDHENQVGGTPYVGN